MRRQGVAVALAIVVWGTAIAVFGFATALWTALAMLAIAGCADEISAILRSTILFASTPDHFRGRMQGFELAQVASTPALGNVEAGIVASLTSLRFSSSPAVSRAPPAPSRSSHSSPTCSATTPAAARYQIPVHVPDGLSNEFFARSVHEVAPELIGATLLVDGVGGLIVEVEAYDPRIRRATASAGRHARNASMFGSPGHAYVYRSYGIHWCLNLVCADEGVAEAVLVRALEPTHGLEADARSGAASTTPRLLCSPGRADSARRSASPASTTACRSTGRRSSSARGRARPRSSRAPRIGITRAAELPWRYVLAGSRFVSRACTQSVTGSPGAGGHPGLRPLAHDLRPGRRAR